jgi:hypothetical protein
MFTIFDHKLALKMKLGIRQRLSHHNHAFQANEQRGAGNTSEAKVKSDLDKSIVHSS